MENDFLKHLSSSQVREIVDYMERKTVAAGTYIIREGDTGTRPIPALYVYSKPQTMFRHKFGSDNMYGSVDHYRGT